MEAARGAYLLEKTPHGRIENMFLAFKIKPVIFVRDSWFPIFLTNFSNCLILEIF